MKRVECKWIPSCVDEAVGAAVAVTHCMTERHLVCRKHAGDAVGFGMRVVLFPSTVLTDVAGELDRIRRQVFVAEMIRAHAARGEATSTAGSVAKLVAGAR